MQWRISSRLLELADVCQALINEQNQAYTKIVKDLFEDFKRDSYWPVGQPVEFNFIVYPDGKQFEIDSFSNES